MVLKQTQTKLKANNPYQSFISWGSTLLKMKPTSYTDFVYINTGGLTSALPGDGQRCAIK